VELTAEQIRGVVEKTNACLAWGGALDLAPADDLFIQVEYPLSIDPLLLPSIMSKKKAIGAEYVVIDIPAGRGAKVKTIGEAHYLANDFLELGGRLGMQVECAITYGEQPVGCAVGPALEAREALETLMGGGPPDLREKALTLAGILLEMAGHEEGRQAAGELLRTGKAQRKLREIIAAQGGDPEVKPDSIRVGNHMERFVADRTGKVLWINNGDIAQVARAAGAPKDKGAGLLLKAKIGDEVTKGAALMEIYAERAQKLEEAFSTATELQPIGLERSPDQMMLIDRIPAKAIHEKTFLIER
jgi:AMP phosphorylase